MTQFYFLISLFIIFIGEASAQTINFHLLQKQLDIFNKLNYQKIIARDTALFHSNEKNATASGVKQLLKFHNALHLPAFNPQLERKSAEVNDTLFVSDTLTISGSYTHNGPIIILNGGLLHFKNANATIFGDIYVWGANSRLYADSSYLYIPQLYFYQRSLIVIDGGTVHYHHTTLDHSGLSHNLYATNNATIEMTDVKNIGFTTNGTFGNARISINGTNEAGEYIITDSANLSFKHANTILLWHQFADTAIIQFAFPKGDTLHSYAFNNTIAGVKGVKYSIQVDTSTNVMWGMMPSTGSSVTISNSKIRAIGLWFKGSDTITVNGLVNNTHYASFTADLSDRNLQLNNCDVQTWSLYPMDKSQIKLSGCIVGEIGTEQHSTLNGLNFTCDGSGGYMWASDTSFLLAGFCSAVNSVRSQGNSILLFAYSSLMNGYPSALNNSLLMVTQCNVLREPVPYDKACVWYALIENPFESYVDTVTAIMGSAWITKTASSNLMDFNSYRLFYQQNGETLWNKIPTDSLQPKHNDTLGMWDTHRMAPGQYNIKLVLLDNFGNPLEAIKAINLLPKAFDGLKEQTMLAIHCYPIPAKDHLIVESNQKHAIGKIEIVNTIGQQVLQYTINTQQTYIKTSELNNGLYLIKITTESGVTTQKIVIKK